MSKKVFKPRKANLTEEEREKSAQEGGDFLLIAVIGLILLVVVSWLRGDLRFGP